MGIWVCFVVLFCERWVGLAWELRGVERGIGNWEWEIGNGNWEYAVYSLMGASRKEGRTKESKGLA